MTVIDRAHEEHTAVGAVARLGARALPYLVTAALSTAVTVLVTRMWRATWSTPFQWVEDTVASAGHFATTLETGWYEFQPRLGWPYGQRYHDFPISDDLMQATIKALGIFSDDWVWVFNTFYLLSFPAAAVTALFFLRRCTVATPLAVVLAVLYSIAPYHFFRGERHFFLSQYWMVPLALWVALGVIQGRRIWAGRVMPTSWPPLWRTVVGALTGRGAGTAVVLVLVTLSGAYYGVFSAVLIAGAGALAWLRRRDWARLGAAVVATAVVGLTLVLGLLPDLLYIAAHGGNQSAVARDANGAEMYALTLGQLLMPNPGHNLPILADLRGWFDSEFPYGAERTSLGLVAAVGLIGGFIILAALLFGRLRPVTGDQPRDARRLLAGQLSALMVLGVVASSVGGVGSLIALVASNSVRGWNRMSIFIMLLALAVVGLGVQALLERWHRRAGFGTLRSWTAVSAAALLLVGTYDQGTSGAVPDYAAVAETFNDERAFVASIEAQLPAGDAVFQYPRVQWPEGPGAHHMHSNDQLRMYLHSKTLNWSGGAIKGRPQAEWPATVTDQEPAPMLEDLAIIGFSGIVVDRWGLDNFGAEFEAAITPITGPPTAVTANGRFSFFPLTAEVARVEALFSPEERAAEADRLTNGATTAPAG